MMDIEVFYKAVESLSPMEREVLWEVSREIQKHTGDPESPRIAYHVMTKLKNLGVTV